MLQNKKLIFIFNCINLLYNANTWNNFELDRYMMYMYVINISDVFLQSQSPVRRCE